MQKTDAELTTQFEEIGDETTAGENTRTRIESAFQNSSDSKINNDKIETAVTLDTVGRTVAGRDAVKAYADAIATAAASYTDTAVAGTSTYTDAAIDASEEATNTSIALKSNRQQPDITAKTDNYTLAYPTDDTDDWIPFNIATAKTLTVPLNSTAAFPVGYQKIFYRTGAGTLTVAATGGVTITSSSTGLTDPGANIPMILRKTGTNTWALYNGATPLTYSTLTATLTGFASTTVNDVTYTIEGKRAILKVVISGTGNTTNTPQITNLPFVARASVLSPIIILNNGTAAVGRADITAGTSTITFYATATAGSFTSNTARQIHAPYIIVETT